MSQLAHVQIRRIHAWFTSVAVGHGLAAAFGVLWSRWLPCQILGRVGALGCRYVAAGPADVGKYNCSATFVSSGLPRPPQSGRFSAPSDAYQEHF